MEARPERRYRGQLILKGCWVRGTGRTFRPLSGRASLCLARARTMERARIRVRAVVSEEIYIARIINGGEIQ